MITLLDKKTDNVGCQVSSIRGFKVTKFRKAGSGFLTLGVSCTEYRGKRPPKGHVYNSVGLGFIVLGHNAWSAWSQPSTSNDRVEFARSWPEASMPGCYQGTHTHHNQAVCRRPAAAETVLRDP